MTFGIDILVQGEKPNKKKNQFYSDLTKSENNGV